MGQKSTPFCKINKVNNVDKTLYKLTIFVIMYINVYKGLIIYSKWKINT